MSDALTALREALAVSPNNIPLRIHLGRTLLKVGRTEEAYAEFKTALAKERDRADARLGAGAAALALGRWSEAVEHWWPIRTTLENDELRELARAAVQAQRREEAQKAYDELLARDPSLRDLSLDRVLRQVGPPAPPKPGPVLRPQTNTGRAPVPVIRPSATTGTLPPNAPAMPPPLSPSNSLPPRPALSDTLAPTPVRPQVVPDFAAPPSDDPDITGTTSLADIPPMRPDVTFADIGGLEGLKERLRMDIIYPLQRPDLFKAYGKKVGGGVLLYGPPGCGKTHVARAAAGESGVSFISVEINQVLDMWLGESEKRLHEIFERARAEAPTILFFDEMEAIGAARHQVRQGPGRRLVNQLLSELDGVGSKNESILVLGATNAPWDVDPALRRPGRFDRVIFVPPPDQGARETILKICFKDRPVEGLDFSMVARRTARFSGADLRHLAEVASERALAEALRSGAIRPITNSDVLASLDRVRPTTMEWMETAKRFVTYANQAGVYDEVARYLDKEVAG